MCSIDFYGVYEVLDPLAVLILLWMALGNISNAIHITIYHELIATLPFIGVMNFTHKVTLQVVLACLELFHVSLYCATFFVDNRTFLLVGSTAAAAYGAIIIIVVNGMHFLIRRHYKIMEKAQLKCYIG